LSRVEIRHRIYGCGRLSADKGRDDASPDRSRVKGIVGV
jgi:hypothetical protein